MHLKGILAYPLSVVYYIFFITILLVFHLIQWGCFYGFGYQAHKKSVDLLNLSLLRCLNILGVFIDFEHSNQLQKNTSYIIVPNHQSMMDIPPLIWYFRAIHPKFVGKKELGKNIPSVSFNLRHGGSVLIDRKNPAQAMRALDDFAYYLNFHKRSAVIFPEGTRSRNQLPRRFQTKGLHTLLTKVENAVVLPVSINHSWKLNAIFPMPIGIRIHFKVHEGLRVSDFEVDELIPLIEKKVKSGIKV